MSEQQREVDAGEQVLIVCKLTKYNVATEEYETSDASTDYPKYSVVDYAGTEQQAPTSMTKQTTGYYYVWYTIPTDCAAGWAVVKIATENDTTISFSGFLVKR